MRMVGRIFKPKSTPPRRLRTLVTFERAIKLLLNVCRGPLRHRDLSGDTNGCATPWHALVLVRFCRWPEAIEHPHSYLVTRLPVAFELSLTPFAKTGRIKDRPVLNLKVVVAG